MEEGKRWWKKVEEGGRRSKVEGGRSWKVEEGRRGKRWKVGEWGGEVA